MQQSYGQFQEPAADLASSGGLDTIWIVVLGALAFALRVNNLKLSASRGVIDVVQGALGVVGIAGYRNDTPHSLGRHLRDALSAPLMINNARIEETNAALAVMQRGEPR